LSIEKNKQTALTMLKAVGAWDTTTMAKLMAPGATWWVLGSGPREAGTSREPFLEALPATMGRLFAGPVIFTARCVTAEGDRVAVEADSEGQLANGLTYCNMYHFLFVFAGDEIVAVREYNDTAYMKSSFS
jgi:uncharacterized protein